MAWLFSTFLNMNLGIFFRIFRDHLDAKQFTQNLKSIIPGRILIWNLQHLWCQIQANWILMIYQIYLKSFMIFNDL
jgi:hypothetical protein